MNKREQLEIDYAAAGLQGEPPIDFAGAFRQFVFAAGMGTATGFFVYIFFNRHYDVEAAMVGIGLGVAALTLPWPGRIGRRW